MKSNHTLDGRKLPDDYQPSEYSIGIFLGLNRLFHAGKKSMYEGTVAQGTIEKRRAKNKRARLARKQRTTILKGHTLKQHSKRYAHLEKIAKRATTVARNESKVTKS